MRRAGPIAALVLAALVVLVLGLGASGDGVGGGSYRVRAIFDNAGFVVPGEDVKVAGVKVGSIESLDVTREHKAAVVLRIDDDAFKPFKRDATCEIRLQSLIGEKFVACKPTQPHAPGARQAPPLRKIQHGPGKGQYLLPVQQTSAPVDIDLLNNIMRVPQRQRLAIIINELGVGLAGNGQELRAVIRRADPALREFDQVLSILAGQNRVLARLAVDSDRALAPTARETQAIGRFVQSAGETAQATAERGDALEANFQRFPKFLQELTPTARRLGELASAGTPTFANLRAVAPSVNRIFQQLGPFSQAALPSFRTLGDLSDVGSQALPAAQPVVRDIAGLGRETRPLASDLAKGLTSLQGQHGIERLLDVILNTLGTTNGFDTVSHYLRAYLVLGSCSNFYTTETAGCASHAGTPVRPRSGSAASAPSFTATAAGSADLSRSNATPGTGDAPKQTTNGLLGYLLGGGGR